MSIRIDTAFTETGRLIQQAIDNNRLPGAVVLISHHGENLFHEAFGFADIEEKRPQQKNDLFYLGSTTKPLAVSSIMTLVDEGKIDLDELASEWIPQLSHKKMKNGKVSRPPTIRELLSHTSGIFGNATATPRQQRLVWNFGSSLSETAKLIAKQPYVYEPGSGFSYGGASMTIASRIVELVTDMQFDEFTTRVLFSKLGMADTFYRTATLDKNRFCPLYKKFSRGMHKAQFQPHATLDSFVLPAGGLISTANDLSKFLQLHMNSTPSSVLSDKLIQTMRHDVTNGLSMDFKSSSRNKSTAGIANNEGYGLGWMLDELNDKGAANVIFHGGAFGTLIWADASEELGIVLLTHIPLAEVAELWDKLIGIIRCSISRICN